MVTHRDGSFLPNLPASDLLTRYARGRGNELGSGKFWSPESSAALVANTFGFFLQRPELLPRLPSCTFDWHPIAVTPEVELRFPWRGGLHPWLDVVIETESHLIGIESKRYEPFRSCAASEFSRAYSRDVWGSQMHPYEAMRDALTSGTQKFHYLDAVQLVKHALALRTQAVRKGK